MNVVKVIEIALRLYDKYSKVNIEKLYLRLNEQLQLQKENALQSKPSQSEAKTNRWNYSNMLQRTSNFLSKFKFSANQK